VAQLRYWFSVKSSSAFIVKQDGVVFKKLSST
jgi:hypothetical protein